MKKKRGFAAMSPEKQKELAILGGKISWRLGKAHRWTREEAYLAGMKGGRPKKKKL